MFVPCNNPPGYKEHEFYFISFELGEVIPIINCMTNMRTYVSDIVESYKGAMIRFGATQLNHNCYFTYYSVGVHLQLTNIIKNLLWLLYYQQ